MGKRESEFQLTDWCNEAKFTGGTEGWAPPPVPPAGGVGEPETPVSPRGCTTAFPS